MTQEDNLPHEQHAAAGDRLSDELEDRSRRLGEQIEGARSDWESKKADPGVPGAPPDADDDQVDSDAPEADYPAKGSAEEIS